MVIEPILKQLKIVMAEISKEVPTKFKIHRTYYTINFTPYILYNQFYTVHISQSILPASIFCLAKTFLRHDERCIKHIDHDLMNSGNATRGAHQTSDETMFMAIAHFVTIILTFATPG